MKEFFKEIASIFTIQEYKYIGIRILGIFIFTMTLLHLLLKVS